MRHFEASGLWYPSNDPSNAVGGTLKFDRQGLRLSLLGAFREGWSSELEDYPVIQGVVGNSPYGSFVTLVDSFMTSQKINMVRVTSAEIRSHFAVLGDFHLPNGPVRFEKLTLSYSYLKEWVGRGGLEFDHKRTGDGLRFVAAYTKPKNVVFLFEGGTLTLGFNCKSSVSTHQSSFAEDAAIIIEPVGNLTAEALVPNHVRTIQDLLTFATDTPNAVEEISFLGEKDERGLEPKASLVYEPIFSLEDKRKSLHASDMLFTYADSQDIGLNIFQGWLDFSRKHRVFCDVHFGYTYSEPRYADDRLSKALAAFTLLCSNLAPRLDKTIDFLVDVRSAMKARFSEEERVFIECLIPTGPEVEMPILLLKLMGENSELMGQLIEDFHAFVLSVIDTLDFFERRVEGPRPPLQGGDLHYAAEKIKMLMKIIVLRELGFNEDAVKMLIERNKLFSHLKTV